MTTTTEAPAERVRRPHEPHTCPCGRQWTAASEAHCTGFHRHFSSDSRRPRCTPRVQGVDATPLGCSEDR